MHFIKILLSGLALATMLATFGCNRNSSETQPAASIGQGDASSAKAKGPDSAQSNFDLNHPRVAIDTSLGTITVQLDKEKSSLTVDNFLAYIDSGSYDQTIVHQVYKDQAVIAGGYTANLTEIRPRTPVSNEAHNGLKNLRGTIAMLRQVDVIDGATSQFFINVADNPALDHRNRDPEGYGYCVFGIVNNGMDVVDRIAKTTVKDTDMFDQTPVQPVLIKSIRRAK